MRDAELSGQVRTITGQLLIDEFGEHTPVSTLVLELNNVKFKNILKLLCEAIN